jgi:hypothetical protein
VKDLDIATAPRQDSKHWHQGTIAWADLLKWVETPASRKACGNYVLGKLRDSVRNKTTIVSRSAITLDVDSPAPGFLEGFSMVFAHAALVHTTYNSAPDEPRYRIIIPTDRDLLPDEYIMAATVLMERFGAGQFDPGSVQPERYMFKPSAQKRQWFEHLVLEGSPISADSLLADFTVDLRNAPAPTVHKNKRNPFELDGVVGAFNRVYQDWGDLIATYELPYEPAGEDRWHLVGARSEAGMGPIANTEGLVYSHHVHDPAHGRTCSAFDLVRLHRFGDLDAKASPDTPINKLPSHVAMADLAAVDSRVVGELVGGDFSHIGTDDDPDDPDWRLRLTISARTGQVNDTIGNWDLIRDHDPAFRALRYNELALTIEADSDLPWRPLSRGGAAFSSTDYAALALYLEREYRFRPPRFLVDELVRTTAQRHYFNPIREYLESLEWDGVERMETSLPGVRPTRYTRMVARKSLVAAVARVMDPGCKWDHTTVLFGSEGLGKSFWLHRMAKGFSANLGRIGDKDTLLAMQRSWIMISDEGYSLKKADADVQKEFLTRTEDVFRLPYERESVAHPRHCVIWGTTNDEVFLRRQEGNRRFLIVRCEDRVDFEALTEEYTDQVWAEAVDAYRKGELLFLQDDESAVAADEREQFIEEDALSGLVENYLETLVPPTWDAMSPQARSEWLRDRADGVVPLGTEPINQVCSTQIWVEVLGRRVGDHRRTDLLDITAVLKRVPGWTILPGRHRLPGYGPQVIFQRVESTDGDPTDVL